MKIIRVFAALFIFTSVILPSVAHADEKFVERDVENKVELDSEAEIESPLEEESRDDSLIETDDLTGEEAEDSEPADQEEVNDSVEVQPVDDSLLEAEEPLEEPSEEPSKEPSEELPDEKGPIVEQNMMSVKSLIVESDTSLLGHLKKSTVRIYKDLDKPSNYTQAGSTYTNAVYYIKKQANYNGERYYLISKNASSTVGVVGWVKSSDISTNSHAGVNRTVKMYYVKGTGSAYAKAWGGSKDIVFNNLSNLQGHQFKINLTERVGNNTWHRGILNGKTAWIHDSYLTQSIGSPTSRLGHLKSASTRIYESYATPSKYIVAGSKHTNEVYYIKREASYSGATYYLISRSPSSTQGVVGWVKSTDLNTHTHTHVGVDKDAKKYFVKGTGSSYTKAWGGSKNLLHKNLSGLKDQEFNVNLTERIGNNTWYRGTLDGKTAWIHKANLVEVKESKTSRLGHIRSNSSRIYKDYNTSANFSLAGSAHTNEVYYIKKQATFKNELYYLISRNSSSTKGVIGWVKSVDLSTHPHVGVDKVAKTYYFKGGGTAYTKAWGGSKNSNIANLDSLKGQRFQINLTEKVGNNTWYRGSINGKTAWVHSAYISAIPLKVVNNKNINYNLTLNQMSAIQGNATPQTDKKYPLWIREDAFVKGSISNGQGIAGNATWNLRRGAGANTLIGGQVKGGTKLTIYGSAKGIDDPKFTWYHVQNTSGWVSPDKADLNYYINPNNFTGFMGSLQFLNLTQSANVDVREINEKILKGKGILAGHAQSFVNAGKVHGVNEIYLISHALLETGNGSSTLAKGVKYNGKTVYNMFGIGAYDSCPVDCGAKYAYDAGWFTPELAIIGGTKFIGDGYVNKGQNTLYKMRWDPAFAAANGRFGRQYATDIGWAYKQTVRMNELYGLLDSYNLTLDIPKYK